MKKTLKTIVLSCAFLLSSSLAYDAYAGIWFITYCGDDVLGTYEAVYHEGPINGVLTYDFC